MSSAAVPTLGERLKAARVAAGLTQLQLAVQAEVDPSTVARIESDKNLPRIDKLQSIAKVLGLALEDLLEVA